MNALYFGECNNFELCGQTVAECLVKRLARGQNTALNSRFAACFAKPNASHFANMGKVIAKHGGRER